MEKKISVLNFDNLTATAKQLAQFVKKQNLSVKIEKKEYIMVDGWQWLGAQFGLFPFVRSLKPEGNESEIKYRCIVELRHISTDKIIGVGVAYCSNREVKKRSFAEYAIASMAQTRAIGKAYRNIFGWIARSGGFESTPAEEMEDIAVRGQAAKSLQDKIIAKFAERIEATKTKKDAKKLKLLIEKAERTNRISEDVAADLLDNLSEKIE